MRFADLAISGAVLFLAQGHAVTDWFTPEKFAMGVCVYLLMTMNKTMGELKDAIKDSLPKRGKK